MPEKKKIDVLAIVKALAVVIICGILLGKLLNTERINERQEILMQDLSESLQKADAKVVGIDQTLTNIGLSFWFGQLSETNLAKLEELHTTTTNCLDYEEMFLSPEEIGNVLVVEFDGVITKSYLNGTMTCFDEEVNQFVDCDTFCKELSVPVEINVVETEE